MIVFHGSNRNFKVLRISKSLVNSSASENNEGYGIYFSTDVNVSKSYGRYLYELEISDKHFRDFRRLGECQKYVKELQRYILSKSKIDISGYLNIKTIAEEMVAAEIPIYGVGREVYLFLDSNYLWYNVSETKRNQVYAILRGYAKRTLEAYMFNYHISNIGICKTTNPDVIKIVHKYVI